MQLNISKACADHLRTHFSTKHGVKLNHLPAFMPDSKELSNVIVDFLRRMNFFTGKAWIYDSLEEYIVEVFLLDEDGQVTDELSGVMAETNAYFDETY